MDDVLVGFFLMEIGLANWTYFCVEIKIRGDSGVAEGFLFVKILNLPQSGDVEGVLVPD